MLIKNRIRHSVILLFSYSVIFSSCNFLDVVPDNVATIDHAFRNRTEALSYLYGLLGGMPDVGNYAQDPALAGVDEIWLLDRLYAGDVILSKILKGEQGPVKPYANYWSSTQFGLDLRGGKALWTTISDINFFLENIRKPFDLTEQERDKWIGEALFVKAYLHFWLFRQYGPIPLIRENMSINTGTDEIMRYREPVDEVVDYIVSLLDEAMELLPVLVVSEMEDLGRPNRCIAAALKAQVLTLAASPLFNCNPDYANYRDNRGRQLFPQDQSVEKDKWKKAADALKVAIDMATSEEALHRLYDAHIDLPHEGVLSEETLLAMQVRGAVTERWNPEIIWGNSRANNNALLQRLCCPAYSNVMTGGGTALYSWAPDLRMVEQFYTKNGLPIEDDAEWVSKLEYKRQNGFWAIRTALDADKQYIRQGSETIELHFDREARFYASITFDMGTVFGNNPNPLRDNTSSPTNLFVFEVKYEKLNGYTPMQRATLTGYLCKKLLHYKSGATTSSSWNNSSYAFPIIRLADLYLLYAEALNEWKDAPDAEVYEYIDLVRARSGLKGVVETWNDHAIAEKKGDPANRGKMRDIIHRERLNELAFEGARYWDIRRWKIAENLIHNKPIRGLNIWGKTTEEFYQETVLYTPKFEKKDYFTPIRTEVLVTNINLLQSPFWETGTSIGD